MGVLTAKDMKTTYDAMNAGLVDLWGVRVPAADYDGVKRVSEALFSLAPVEGGDVAYWRYIAATEAWRVYYTFRNFTRDIADTKAGKPK